MKNEGDAGDIADSLDSLDIQWEGIGSDDTVHHASGDCQEVDTGFRDEPFCFVDVGVVR